MPQGGAAVSGCCHPPSPPLLTEHKHMAQQLIHCSVLTPALHPTGPTTALHPTGSTTALHPRGPPRHSTQLVHHGTPPNWSHHGTPPKWSHPSTPPKWSTTAETFGRNTQLPAIALQLGLPGLADHGPQAGVLREGCGCVPFLPPLLAVH